MPQRFRIVSSNWGPGDKARILPQSGPSKRPIRMSPLVKPLASVYPLRLSAARCKQWQVPTARSVARGSPCGPSRAQEKPVNISATTYHQPRRLERTSHVPLESVRQETVRAASADAFLRDGRGRQWGLGNRDIPRTARGRLRRESAPEQSRNPPSHQQTQAAETSKPSANCWPISRRRPARLPITPIIRDSIVSWRRPFAAMAWISTLLIPKRRACGWLAGHKRPRSPR